MSQTPLMPHDAIATRVRDLRKGRGWSAQRLAEEMVKVGIPWDRSIVANLESRRRRAINVEEFLALAYVLNVAPLHLLVPTKGSAMKVVPERHDMGDGMPKLDAVHLPDARKWIIGEFPLIETDVRIYFSETDEETFRARFGHGSNWKPEDGDDGR